WKHQPRGRLCVSGVDVLVVGLGPAGASAAVAVAAHGMNVLAIDRREEPGRPVQCAEFVPGMLDQMLGFLDSVTNQRVARMVTYVDNQVPDMTPDFRGRMIDRAAFDAGLVRHAIRAG